MDFGKRSHELTNPMVLLPCATAVVFINTPMRCIYGFVFEKREKKCHKNM